ncbi:MAG: tetratricopeptide repeat protein [Anaerolineae bacterium]|nr:tetratricopeptide repeat protein [Anaerolineae bacterium]
MADNPNDPMTNDPLMDDEAFANAMADDLFGDFDEFDDGPNGGDQFNHYLEEGNIAAWDLNWPAAIDAFTRAVQLRPDDPEGHINLGLALLQNGQLPQALKVYKRANQLSPEDPLPLERSADVLERMGQLREAAQQYVKVSELYIAQRDLDKAISNWERATQLTPGLVSVHARLAQAYERIGDKDRAIREYLTLAFNFQRLDDVDKAIRAVERALRLNRNNPQALNTLRALRSGGEVILPNEYVQREAPAIIHDTGSLPPLSLAFDDMDEEDESNPLGPMGESLDEAMEMLAEHVVESGLSPFVAPALQAMELQRQGEHKAAIAAYENALSKGLKHPALKMNLGGLYALLDEPKEALKHLGDAVNVDRLKSGALHAIGRAYYLLGDHAKGAEHLIESLRQVDMSLAYSVDEVEQLDKVYDGLSSALGGRTKEVLSSVNERFLNLLTGTDWKVRISDTRRHLDETLRDEGGEGMVDLLVAKGGHQLAEAVGSIDRYIRQGLYTLAIDEAHYTVEKSPFYLPVHVRMAEVMMKEGRIRQAINKYNTVARAYLVRDEHDRAASILGMVLEMAPLDVDVRMNLIELLESQERTNEALDQYIALAETYQQLGDFDRANQTYVASERLARRIDAPVERLVQIKQYIADISQMRLNTRQAQRVYEEILEIQPENERALRAIIDIYYAQGNNVEAIKRLDKLLSVFARQHKIKEIASLLEGLVRSNPQDTALRARMASIYRKMGQKDRAIEQLDALGELQLDAGLTRDAANTIRQIIGMNPDRVEDYKRLLSQLNG